MENNSTNYELITDIDIYKSYDSKYNKLIEHPSYTNYIIEYLKNINSKWSNINLIKRYLFYVINNDTIHIYFYNHLIISNKLTDRVSDKTIVTLFDNIKKTVIDNHILLNFKYMLYILDACRSNIASLISEQIDTIIDNKLRLDFKITDDTISFYIRYNEVFNCKINELENNIKKIFKLYNSYFKRYKKVALILKNKYFKDHSSVNILQKTFFQNNYWLDISTTCENSIEREIILKDLYNKYDNIILDYCPDMTLSNNYNNKKIIMIPNSYGHDINMKFNRNESIKAYKQNPVNNNLIRGIRNLDTIESIISTGYIHKYISSDYKLSYLECSLHNEMIGCLRPDNSVENKSLLNKKDFYKTFNLDINKNIITIFLVWPVIDSDAILNPKITRGPKTNHKIFRPQFLNFEYSLYYENSLLIKIIDILQKTYNVVVKLHPNNTKMVNNKMYIYKGIESDHPKNKTNLDLNNIKDTKSWGISNLLEKYSNIIIDYNYHEELLNYTNLGIIFYPSTVSWYTHIYGFPMIHISSNDKENDWFRWIDYTQSTHKSIIREKDYRDLDKLVFNKEKLSKLRDILFGDFIYIEDIYHNLETNILSIVSENLKKKYGIAERHPLFEDNGQEEIAQKLIDIITTKYSKIKPSIVIDVEPERR